MARLYKRFKQHGFTLVELLIVVAIIGVLSTIGIPTFRRMVQKSKKAEAKVNLGGLYTAEQSFFSEYGGYGTNLRAMGFQTDGANMMYRIGFPTANCGNVAIRPVKNTANGIGPVVNTTFPAYYLPTKNQPYLSVMGGNFPTKCPSVAQANIGAYSAKGVAVANNQITVQNVAGGDSNAFLAIAAGVIAPGVTKTNPNYNNNEVDIWAIDEERRLSNTVDGVQ